MYCQIRLGLLYCFAVLFIVISVSNISPRIIMKRKAMAVQKKPPYTSVERQAENFPRNENIKLQLACDEALYFGRDARIHARAARVKKRECEGRGERRVLSRLPLLSSRLNFNSCRPRYSFS